MPARQTNPGMAGAGMGRRELLKRAAALGIVLGPVAAFRSEAAEDIRGKTIRFINYTNWIGKGEYDKFKAKTGCEVREIPINQNRSERMLADPTAADMILDPLGPLGTIEAARRLAKLNLANIPNYALIHYSFKQGLASPEQSKAVPIDWGRSGILFRSDVVTQKMSGWADFWSAATQHSGKVLLPSSPNHVIRNALLMLGFNGSSRVAAEVDKAADAVIRLKPHVQAFSAPNAVKRLLEGSAVMSMAEEWQGASAIRDNPQVGFKWIDPVEGASGYLDCIGAVNTTSVLPAIEQFLNFHLEPENAAHFCNTLSSAPIMPESVKFLEDKIKNDPILNPTSEVLARVNYWTFLGEAQRIWDAAWTRVQSA